MKQIFLFFSGVVILNSSTAQNVGIGTNTPQTCLHVINPSDGYGITHESGSGIRLATYIDGGGAYLGTRDNAPLHFYTNDGLSQISLLTNGNTGIGVSNPQYKLDILGRMRIKTSSIGNIYTTPGVWLDDYRDGSNRIFFGMQDSIRLGIWGDGTPGAGWAFNFNARNGNVGIGVTNPVSKLEVNGDITAQNFTFSTPKTYYYAIPPASFSAVRIGLGEPGAIFVESPTTYPTSTIHSNMTYNIFVAPVHLPDGATVTAITYWGIDNLTTPNIQFSLRRRAHGSDVYEVLNTVSSSGNPGNFSLNSTTINYPVIDNDSYNYTLYVDCPGGSDGESTRIKSVRIAYTMQAPD